MRAVLGGPLSQPMRLTAELPDDRFGRNDILMHPGQKFEQVHAIERDQAGRVGDEELAHTEPARRSRTSSRTDCISASNVSSASSAGKGAMPRSTSWSTKSR